ncbi:MAG: nucleotide exchange factor GrpE [Algoriphagus sp.]|nr:nucleotide exchange factor GrpE [Algoriphagus sp.]
MKNKERADSGSNKNEEQVVDETSAKNSQEASSESAGEIIEPIEKKFEDEIAELKDKYLRLYSDFENYRKRTAKERLDLITTASEDVLKELIPVVDDFERAFKANESQEDAVKVREGNQLIFHKLLRTLENRGLKPMDNLIGKPFNPDTQEAITSIPSPSEDMKGKVIDVVEKGYTLGEKVVRFAKVVTGA